MVGILAVLTAVSVAMLVVGIVWMNRARGVTTRRSGREVGAELMAEKMDRAARYSGKRQLYRKTWFWGMGWAVEREASFSYAEIGQAIREGRTGEMAHVILGMAGMVGTLLSIGGLLLHHPKARIPGGIFLAAGLYAAYLVISGVWRAATADGASTGPGEEPGPPEGPTPPEVPDPPRSPGPPPG